MSAARLLIVDDDVDLAELAARRAREHGFNPTLCHDGRELTRERVASVDVIVLDLVMPGFDGVQVLRRLADFGCRAPVVLCSSLGRTLLSSAARLGRELGLCVAGTLQKPYQRRDLVDMLNSAQRTTTVTAAATTMTGPAPESVDPRDLLVLFQPKIDLSTLDFSAVEALVRWQHPTRGLVGPGFFIPAAERAGHIEAITMAVFDKALSQAARWMRDGLVLKVSVNLSTRLLDDVDLPDRLEAAAARHGIEPGCIVLEVTETWLHVDQVAALDSLTRLRIKGFELSIDDFGTGYASLQQLAQFPFSELKIDRSFVSQAPYSEQALHILRTSIELGQRLDLNVVAEGVENQDQWDLICHLGCDECQGFFIARPLHSDDTPAWLQRWRAIQGRSADGTRLRVAS